jgi:hypothetical protein
MANRRCWGLSRNLHRCGRAGDWLLFCDEHSRQPYGWLVFLVFTVVAGTASIQSAWFQRVSPDAPPPTNTRDSSGVAEARAYRLLNKATIRFSSTLRDVMLAGTEGWLPRNRAEFFSDRGVVCLCRHTNAESAFGGHGQLLITYLATGAREYLSALHEVLNAAQSSVDPDTYRAASVVESAVLLNMLARKDQVPLRFRENYVPLLCFGTEDHAREFFVNFQSLVDALMKHSASIPVDEQEWWSLFPDYPNGARGGRNHFSEADLQQWLAAHPGRDGKVLALPRDPR